MIKMPILFSFVVFSCIMQPSLSLKSKLPIGKISFKDSSEIFINKVSSGILTVSNLYSDQIEVQLFFKKKINIPNNSVLVYLENPVGDSFFEIKMGDSKNNFKNEELIFFKNIYLGKSHKDTSSLKRLTEPKIIIEN